jgi:dolichol-phosphate mannosyltransferase
MIMGDSLRGCGWHTQLGGGYPSHLENLGSRWRGHGVLDAGLTPVLNPSRTIRECVPLGAIKLSIVVTVYSETSSIDETVKILLRLDRGYIQEILLLVSPQASEETFAICRRWVEREPRVRIVLQKNNPGIGWAYREGMEAAKGNYVALMAADLETEPAAVDRMVQKVVETGCDEVIANRWLPGGGFTNYDPLKLVLNWIFQRAFRVFFWTRIGDFTFGLKLLSKEVVDAVEWEGTMHEICIETTVKPLKEGFRLEQVPTVWVGRREGHSVNTFFKNFRYVKLGLKTLLKPGPNLRSAPRRSA